MRIVYELWDCAQAMLIVSSWKDRVIEAEYARQIRAGVDPDDLAVYDLDADTYYRSWGLRP